MDEKTKKILFPRKRAKKDWFDDHPRKKGPHLIQCPSCKKTVEWQAYPNDNDYRCMSCREKKSD